MRGKSAGSAVAGKRRAPKSELAAVTAGCCCGAAVRSACRSRAEPILATARRIQDRRARSREGPQRNSGIKARLGVEAAGRVVHPLAGTAVSVARFAEIQRPLHGQKERGQANPGYTGVYTKVAECAEILAK